jgi:predicted outer membrane protein
VVSRRWMWVAAGLAAGTLLGARVAHAGRAEEDRPGNRPADMQLPAPAAPASAAAPLARSTAKPAVRRVAPAAAYAADAARSSTRLPADERAARAFLRTAAMAARIENDASRLAATRAQGDGVREFAADLLKYHESADLELLWLLHARDMAPPMLETAQRKALGHLARLEGAKFDRAYVELVSVRRQRSDVQQFERAAAAVTDPSLKAWIERQLPALREQQVAAARLAGRPAQVAQQANRLRLTRTIASRSTASNTR